MISEVGLSKDSKTRPVTAANGENFEIRLATSSDREALCRVCLLTGDSGKDGSSFFKDPLILGRRWVLPYVDLEPAMALCLVSLENDEVCGYALGCLDTVDFARRLEKEYLPKMREIYPRDLEVEAPFQDSDVVKDFYKFELPPEEVYTKYPSHMHIDLVPRVQGAALGRTLLGTLLHTIRSQGENTRNIHLEMSKSNSRAASFYRRCGFRELCPRGDDIYLGLHAQAPAVPGDFTASLEGLHRDLAILAVPSCLWDWKESHLRAGEPYDSALAAKAASAFDSYMSTSLSEKATDGGGSRARELESLDHVRVQYGSAYLLWCLSGEPAMGRLPLGLCISVMMLLQLQTLPNNKTVGDLVDSAPTVREVVRRSKMLAGAEGSFEFEDPALSGHLGNLRGVLLGATKEGRKESLEMPGYFTYFGAPDETTTDLVVNSLKEILDNVNHC